MGSPELKRQCARGPHDLVAGRSKVVFRQTADRLHGGHSGTSRNGIISSGRAAHPVIIMRGPTFSDTWANIP